MKTLRTALTALTLIAGFSLANTNTATAQPPYTRVAPGYTLGVSGFHSNGGFRIDSVVEGSVAQQVGLEPGDVILRINGQSVATQSGWVQAINNSGGQVQLAVRNVRDGGIVMLDANLGGSPPILYSRQPRP